MPTSGTQEFTKNTTSLIEDAYDTLGIFDEGESITSSQRTKATRKLNYMIQAWQADGVHLWKYREATLFLEKDTQSYLLGNSQGNATENFVETTINTDAILGASTIDLVDSTGILDGYYIGIHLDDGTAQWTTVNGNPIGNTVTLTDVLNDSVSSNNEVKSYETKITKPVKILQSRYVSGTNSEIECFEYNRSDYFRLSDKSTTGATTQFYYNPLIKETKLYVWPVADKTFRLFKFTYYPEFDIFNEALDTPDFPSEWYECIVYNLAEKIAPSVGMSEQTSTYQTISRKAREFYDKLSGFDSDDGIIRIMNHDNTGISLNVY